MSVYLICICKYDTENKNDMEDQKMDTQSDPRPM